MTVSSGASADIGSGRPQNKDGHLPGGRILVAVGLENLAERAPAHTPPHTHPSSQCQCQAAALYSDH